MGLLDGVEHFLEDKLFRKMEEQFRELIDEIVNIRKQMENANNNIQELIEIEKNNR